MGFFGQIEGPIKSVLNELFNDQELRKMVTYRLYDGQEFSEEEGYNVNAFKETSLPVLRLKHTFNSSFIGISNVQVGDQLYLVRFEDAPIGLSLKDEVKDENGVIQKIKSVDNIFNLAYAVTIEGGYH